MAHQPLPGYEPLPDFPQEQPDPSARNVEELEGWSGSRTVVMESGFGSDSFDNKYRNNSRFSTGGASTAMSGIEAMGNSSMYSPSSSNMKKKGNDYDLDAFYDESSEEEDSSEEEETSSEEEESEEEESEAEESKEEESEYSDSSSEEEGPALRRN